MILLLWLLLGPACAEAPSFALPGSLPRGCFASAPAGRQEALPLEEFESRRARLFERIGDAVAVLDASVGTRPASKYDLAYLADCSEKDAILILSGPEKKAYLFVEDVAAAKKATGIADVFPRKGFEEFAAKLLPDRPKVLCRLRASNVEIVARHNPKVEHTLGDEITRLRLVKSPREIALIRKAADATCKGHVALLRVVRPGVGERDVQAAAEKVFKDEGCPDLGFGTICGGGRNGTILHYRENKDPLPKDSLIVCDMGAAIRGYVADITRTFPTGGKFTAGQRAKYEIVREAQTAAEKILKPGITLRALHAAAAKVFEERKATKWSFAHSADKEVRHGLGHFVGMYVHDSGTGDTKLEPGMVITIEPGWYDRDQGWGIRIEDLYLVTADGFERLSKSAPREIDEIEKGMEEK